MTRQILKILFASPLIIFSLLIIYVNITVSYNNPDFTTSHSSERNTWLLEELRGLKKSLQQNADIEMQEYYPEGYVFMNAVYGLAWADFLESANNAILFNEGHHEIQAAWERINSGNGSSQFDEDLPLPFGAFYSGWNNYLLGKKLNLERPETRNENETFQFAEQCKKIALALENSVYPVSYSGGAWPADVMVGVASLQLHDRIFENVYHEVIKNWLRKVKGNLDNHGLIPHSVHPGDGAPEVAARGSSQCLMLILLNEIDPVFASQQFLLFRKHFVDDLFGLTGIREYPIGESGSGDVDSGPVIFGFGGAATIVGMRTLATFDDPGAAHVMRVVESFGLPMKKAGSKTYFFGLLPMADAFISWSHNHKSTNNPLAPSFKAFHLYSIVALIGLISFAWILIRPTTPDSARSLHVPW